MTRPDTVFLGGRVFRGTGAGPTPEGVAVAGGGIVAMGPDDEVRALARRSTDVVDLAGGRTRTSAGSPAAAGRWRRSQAAAPTVRRSTRWSPTVRST